MRKECVKSGFQRRVELRQRPVSARRLLALIRLVVQLWGLVHSRHSRAAAQRRAIRPTVRWVR